MSPQIELGDWTPDSPVIGAAPSLSVCTNVLPIEQGYAPFKAFVRISAIGSLSAYCRGAFAGLKSDGTEFMIAGDATKLYSSGSGSYATIGTGFTNATQDNWSFCRYGAKVIATNYKDAPQYWDYGAAVAPLSADASFARYCAVVRKFVVLGNVKGRGVNATPIGTLNDGIHWGAYDNSTSWPEVGTADAKSKQSDYQPMTQNGGAVQGVVGGMDYGLVFQERALTRLQYVGGEAAFALYPLERARGAMIPGSIVSHGSLCFYAAEDGFFMFDGAQSSPIGFGKIDRSVYARMDQGNFHRWSSAIMPETGIVAWLYPASGSTDGTPNKLLLYSYKAGKWATCDFSGEMLVRSTQGGFVIDNYTSSLDAVASNLDTFGPALHPAPLGAFDSSHYFGTFSGVGMTGLLETEDAELGAGKIATVHGVRPIYDKTSDGTLWLFVYVGSRLTANDANTYDNCKMPNLVTGIAPARRTGRYHRVKLVPFIAGFDRLYGLDVQAVIHGDR